jgi:hypothetical protein
MSRGLVRLERDGHRPGLVPVGAGGSRRSDRLTRRFDAQEMVPSASTSSGAAAIARGEESHAEAFECFFRRPSVARLGAVALCATVVTSAWSLATAASSGLGPSREVSNRLRPLPTVPVLRVLLTVPWRRRVRSMLHVIMNRRGGVAIDRHGTQIELTLVDRACQGVEGSRVEGSRGREPFEQSARDTLRYLRSCWVLRWASDSALLTRR